MRLSTALMAVVVLAIAMPALGQIRGTVTDQHGQLVAGALVIIEVITFSASRDDFSARMIERGQKWRALTNASGEFIIGVPSSGVYLVTASKQSIGNHTTQVMVKPGSFTTADLRLQKASAAAITEDCVRRRSANKAFEQSVLAAGGDPGLARLVRWLAAVQRHTPGCGDEPATEVGSWSKQELETLLRDVRELVKFLQRAGEGRSEYAGRGDMQRDRLIFFIYNRRFTLDELERTFYDNEPLIHNELLRRGAVLHADIAVFVPGNLSGEPLVHDCGQKGWRSGTVQWEIGRQLLDSITPSPAADASAVLWYRAVSAYLLRKGNLAEAAAHLGKARQVFPDRPVFLLDSAYLHQEWSSPAIRAAVDALRIDGVNVGLGSRQAELQRAERFLRQALALVPNDADARLRLGHTLGELGRHQEAAAELRKAIDAKPGGRHLYLAELFLGRQEHVLGRRPEAKRRFESAAALYPTAQSPRLALSQLARQFGDEAGAQGALQGIGGADWSDGDRTDPWWDYYQPHLEDAEPLMDQMRKLN